MTRPKPATLILLSFLCLAVLRSLIEASDSASPPVRGNHWRELEQRNGALRLELSHIHDQDSPEGRAKTWAYKREIALNQWQSGKLYEASLILSGLWKELSLATPYEYNRNFADNAALLGDLYMEEGNIDESVRCYQSLLEYQANFLKGDQARLAAARCYNNLGLGYYLQGSRMSGKEKRRYYKLARQMYEKALANSAAGGREDKETLALIKRNLRFLERDDGKVKLSNSIVYNTASATRRP